MLSNLALDLGLNSRRTCRASRGYVGTGQKQRGFVGAGHPYFYRRSLNVKLPPAPSMPSPTKGELGSLDSPDFEALKPVFYQKPHDAEEYDSFRSTPSKQPVSDGHTGTTGAPRSDNRR